MPSHHPPQIVIERAFDIAHYVLASDVKLGEGETVGTSHDERIPIKVGTSMAQRDIEVLSLELPDELK
ncbi:MAG: DUF4261 domain-containing protein [Planctomycetota bacterium]|nr:DUF4261 domain-containing protein [Planctomycetota bacterium]